MIRRAATLLVFGLILATPVGAQVVSIEDANPDTSNLGNPNGATGGRVNGTAVDPTSPLVLYAATEWGGLYKSVDRGDTWQRLEGHRPVVTWDVEVDPGNAARVYATSFHDGKQPSISQSGINVSTDGGVTWVHPATAVPPAGLCANADDQSELAAFGIGINPANPATVYIGTSCGLAISTDSGVTWSYESPVPAAGRIWDVVAAANGTGVDTCGDHGHWFRDTSGSWSAGSGLPSGLCSIAASPYSPGNLNLFATTGLKIYETENGFNWVETRSHPDGFGQGRIPFLETNKRSMDPAGQVFDLWFGDISLYRVTCDSQLAGANCGTGNIPAWSGGYTHTVGGHDDMGSIVFDSTAANDACPVLMSSDGGVYRNVLTSSPTCHDPSWLEPSVTPHALWPWTLSGADSAGGEDELLYFGNQDNGVFGTVNAGAATPSWDNEECCDGFDTAASSFGGGEVVFSVCCYASGSPVRWFKANADFTGRFEIDPPFGYTPTFSFRDAVVNWGDGKYAMINVTGAHITEDINTIPTTWTKLGPNATQPPGPEACGIQTYSAGSAQLFYVQTGNCNAESTTDRLFVYEIDVNSIDTSGNWLELSLPQGGFGIFTTVSQGLADGSYTALASGFTPTGAFMYRSNDYGLSWSSMANLDNLMSDGGNFEVKNQRGHLTMDATVLDGYHQPSLVGIDPTDSTIMVAGGRDSGIFVSVNSGDSWNRVTDPLTSHVSGVPHIPRPLHAYFDAEPDGSKSIYVSSQGGGIWRLRLPTPDAFENDDTPVQASAIGSGVPQDHSIWPVADIDWATFTLTERSAVTIATSGNLSTAPAGLTRDTEFWLRDASTTLIEHDDDDGPGLYSYIERSCALNELEAGTYYIEVSAFGDFAGIDAYQLSLDITPCCGDGNVDPGEACDDGNNAPGDCCSATCSFEPIASPCFGSGDLCVQDSCDGAGTCIPANCGDSNLCTDDTCSPEGSCVFTNNQASCDDGDSCSIADVCGGGVCQGTPVDVPGPIQGLGVEHTALSWTAALDADSYDVIGGDLSLLLGSSGDLSVAATRCYADDYTSTTIDEDAVPASGEGFFYLMRGVGCAGPGSYDTLPGSAQVTSRDPGIDLASITCTWCETDAAGLAGEWSGAIDQNPWFYTLEANVTTCADVGSVIGTSSYPEFDCGGNWVVTSVDGNKVTVDEQLTFGLAGCADHCVIELTYDDATDTVTYYVDTCSGAPVPPGMGTLDRVQKQIAFVTSGGFTGDLVTEANGLGLGPFNPAVPGDGLQAADAICNYHAQNATPALPGSYKAWVSDGTSDARDRLVSTGPWIRTDGASVAADVADLTNCVPDCLDNPIDKDESGILRPPISGGTTGAQAMTGTLADGTAGANNCVDWTSSDSGGPTGNVLVGLHNVTDSQWTVLGNSGCLVQRPIYCFGFEP